MNDSNINIRYFFISQKQNNRRSLFSFIFKLTPCDFLHKKLMWHLNLHLITVSLSPLETRGNHFKFLFSIGLFGLSSCLLTLSIVYSLTLLWKMMTIEIMTKVIKVSIKCQPRVLGPSNCCKETQLAIFLGNWQLLQKIPIGTIKHSASGNNQPCTSAQVHKIVCSTLVLGLPLFANSFLLEISIYRITDIEAGSMQRWKK